MSEPTDAEMDAVMNSALAFIHNQGPTDFIIAEEALASVALSHEPEESYTIDMRETLRRIKHGEPIGPTYTIKLARLLGWKTPEEHLKDHAGMLREGAESSLRHNPPADETTSNALMEALQRVKPKPKRPPTKYAQRMEAMRELVEAAKAAIPRPERYCPKCLWLPKSFFSPDNRCLSCGSLSDTTQDVWANDAAMDQLRATTTKAEELLPETACRGVV